MSGLEKSLELAITHGMASGFAGANRQDPGPKVRCLRCYTEIQSMFRHDFQTCKCGDISIDGGGSYTKMSVMDGGTCEEVREEPPPEAA